MKRVGVSFSQVKKLKLVARIGSSPVKERAFLSFPIKNFIRRLGLQSLENEIDTSKYISKSARLDQ